MTTTVRSPLYWLQLLKAADTGRAQQQHLLARARLALGRCYFPPAIEPEHKSRICERDPHISEIRQQMLRWPARQKRLRETLTNVALRRSRHRKRYRWLRSTL